MYCRKCGNKLEKNQKFCGKCGTKVAEEENNNVSIIDNFIANGNKSKSNTNSDDNGFISSTHTDVSGKSSNNFINTNTSKEKQDNKKITSKSNKSKKILDIFKIFNKKDSKPKRKVKKRSSFKKPVRKKIKKKKVKKREKKQHKKLNKKLKYAIIVCFIVCFLVCGIFVKLKWKSLNAHKYVLSSLENTYNQINSTYNTKQYNCLKLDGSDKNVRNTYLKINDAKGGFKSKDVLKSLKGLSFDIGYLKDFENNINNYEFILKNKDKNKIASVDMMSGSEDIVFLIPELYENQIGLKKYLSDNDAYCGKYQTISDLCKVINDNSTLFEFNDLVKDKNKNLFNKLISQCKISYNGEEDKLREYNALIDGNLFVDCLVEYFTSIKEDDKIISVLTDFIYVTRAEETLKDSRKTIINSISRIISSFDKIQEVGIDKVCFTVNTKKNIISSINVKVDIKNISLIYNFTTSLKNDNIEYNYDFDIIDTIRDIDLNMCFRGNKIKDKVNKDIKMTLDVSAKNVIKIEINDNFDTKTLSISKCVNTSIIDEYDKHNCVIDLSGKLNVDGVKEFNIDKLKINISTLFSDMFLELRGYIKKTNVNNINILKRNNVEYINILDTNTTNLIEEKINKNFNDIINSFIKCIL